MTARERRAAQKEKVEAGGAEELDEPEYLFVLARARLHKERVSLHLDGAEDCEYDENRTQTDNGCQSAAKVKG